MAGLQFSFTGNNKTLLKNIAQVQNALTAMTNELESNGENFNKFFNQAAKGGIDLTKALAGDAKELEKLAKTMKANLNEMQAAWENLTEEMKQSSLGLIYRDSMKQAAQITDEATDKLSKAGKEAGNAAKGYNGIAVQMQMLAREVPNLANSFTIFMMAIGNNLPMLAEELARANEEVKRMKAAGEQFTPVWKQAFTALWSWQTALIAGVTALTIFGDDIIEMVKGLFNMNEQLKTSEEVMKAYNQALTEGAKDAAKERTELDMLYKASQDSTKSLKERNAAIDALQKKYPSYFGNMSNEAILAGKAAESYKKLSENLVQAARARAISARIEELQAKKIEAELKRTEEENKQKKLEISSNFGNKRNSVTSFGKRQLTEDAKAYREAAKAAAQYTKEIGEYDAQINQLAAMVDVKDLLFTTDETDGGTSMYNDYLQKLEEYEQAKKEAITKGEKAAADAMKDGYLKQLAQMEAAHQAELDAIDQQRNALLQKKRDSLQAQAKAEGREFDATKVQLDQSETALFDNQYNQALTRQAAEIQGFYATLAQMKDAMTQTNKTELEQQLADIDAYYTKELQKAEGFEELKTQLTKNWAAERARVENEARLRENQQAENKAVMTSDVTYLGTGLTERAEREKTEILINYAKERIEILRALGDEQSQAEADSLAKQIEAYNKQLKQPMSVKGWFDSKIFDKLKNKYLELGETEEEAKEKASGFFVGVQNGANQTIEAVGLLQTAFGGLDKGLDQVMSAVSSVASGFAQGGMIGGIATAAGVAVGAIAKLGAADYSQYNKLVEEYDSLLDVWDELISKKTEYINIEWGDEARKAADEAEELAQRQIAAYEELGKARLNSGAGWGSHSIGVRQRKGMSDSGWKELAKAAKEIGFNYNSVADGRMMGLFDLTAEQLEDLQEKAPIFWAQLDDEVRGYLQNIIDCQTEIENMGDMMNEATTGVSFDAFYDNFVSTLTDMESDSEDFAEDFGNYLKNAIMRNIVANKYKGQIQSLYDSWVNTSDSDKNGIFDITPEETAELQAAQKALADAMLAERDALANTFGWATGASYNQEASKGAFSAMSQDTGDELNGRFTAFQISNEAISANTKQIAETINLVLAHLPRFDAVFDDILTQHALSNGYLSDIANYNKKMFNSFTDYLRQIVDNTRNL